MGKAFEKKVFKCGTGYFEEGEYAAMADDAKSRRRRGGHGGSHHKPTKKPKTTKAPKTKKPKTTTPDYGDKFKNKSILTPTTHFRS